MADAVTTTLGWDAKPSTFQYNRVGSMAQMTESLTSTSFRETEVQHYNERQLPEELQIRLFVAPGGMVEATQVSYRYDANGQRISKHVRPAPVIGDDPPRSGSIVEERYVRDGMRLIGVFDENNELKSWNIGGVAGLVGRAIPDPRAFQPVPLYYMTDHLGSIRAVVNASGTVVEGQDYYPYGLTMPGRFYVASDTTREGYTGHELDKETGDYYAGARYYNPALGRWLVVDPLQAKYHDLSPFTYVMNNPVSAFDPDGEVIIFINGLHANMRHNRVAAGQQYWGRASEAVIERFPGEHVRYYDGSLGGVAAVAINIDPVMRVQEGHRAGRGVYHSVMTEVRMEREAGLEGSIKIFTHSMGAAYGRGLVQGLVEAHEESGSEESLLIRFILDIAPYDSGFLNQTGEMTFQVGDNRDWLAGNRLARGSIRIFGSERVVGPVKRYSIWDSFMLRPHAIDEYNLNHILDDIDRYLRGN